VIDATGGRGRAARNADLGARGRVLTGVAMAGIAVSILALAVLVVI
jgi:hypothetical protein